MDMDAWKTKGVNTWKKLYFSQFKLNNFFETLSNGFLIISKG